MNPRIEADPRRHVTVALDMSRPDNAHAIREVSARRFSTADAAEPAVPETVAVVLEAPVTIDIERIESYTLLCTPDDNLALATGFLLSEGIVDSLDDVAGLELCKDDPNVVRVRVKQQVPRIDDAGRNLLIVSSCGLCGAEGLDERLRSLPEVGDSLRVESRILREVGNRVFGRSSRCSKPAAEPMPPPSSPPAEIWSPAPRTPAAITPYC